MPIRKLLITAASLAFLTVACPEPNNDDPGPNNTADDSWESTFDASESGWLLNVAGASSDSIYAVGGTPSEGFATHYDGADWQELELPADTPLLNWVHPFDASTTLMVGNGGAVLRNTGDGWEREETPTEEDLWGVWGAQPDDVWAVGGRGRAEGEATIIRYRDGTWEPVEVPELERPGVNAFFKVWGTAADDVHIVGQNGAILRWDGATLVEQPSGTGEDLISLWGTGPDNIVVVGGRANGVLVHWDGEQWHTESLAPTAGLNGVWMNDPEQVWVVGARGTIRPVTIHGGGDYEVERTTPVSMLALHAIYGFEDFGLLAVGGNFSQPQGPYQGLALHNAGALQ